MSKVITVTKVAEFIANGQTIAGTTIGISTWPEEIAIAIDNRFLSTGHSKNLPVMDGSRADDWTGRGTHHLGYEGLTKRLICAHTGSAPRMAKPVKVIMTLTVEAGIFSGIPQGGLDFIAAVNHEAVIDHPQRSIFMTAAAWITPF